MGNRLTSWALWLLWLPCLGLAACLPSTLSDTALQQKIDQAQSAKNPCGNGKLEPDQGEECDDGNQLACDGCEGCQLRRAMSVTDAKSVAAISDASKLGITAATNFTVETWFNAHTAPVAAGTLAFAGVGKPGAASDAAGYFAMGLYRPDAKNAVYPVCAMSRTATLVAQGLDPVALDSWHHIRCVYLAGSNQLSISVDGKDAQKGAGLLKSVGKLFDSGSWLMIGAVPNEKAPAELFKGLLDEFRIAAGESADIGTSVLYRYEGNEPGTVLLYHMDLADTARVLIDASDNHLDADQVTVAGIPVKQESVLPSAIDACYGFTEEQRSCEPPPNPAPPWCPAQ